MRRPKLFRHFVSFFAATVAALAAPGQDLGRIDFPTSATPAAQEHFLHGVLLLHSFEYDDAREAFHRAQEAEPGFAMAAWGEAMTYNHPIWRRENLEAGRDALYKLALSVEERLAKAPTEREKDYLRAVEILYGKGDKAERDQAYSEAMGRLRQRYPDDLEAASFYALSILGTCHEGRDFATYMRAAAVVEEVFDKNPEHPGALHYLIHAYDDPIHAPLGLRPARIYARIAPAAPHALHMPSHVFLALGMWEETAASNEDSWRVALEQVERDDLPVDHKNFHALLWLEYAYLQQGRFREARDLLRIMEEDVRASGSPRTRSHLASMRAHYLFETGRWDEEIEAPELDGLNLTPAASTLLATGVAALRRDDEKAAAEALAELRRRRNTTTGQDAFAEGYDRVGPQREPEAEVMELELDALLRLARGKPDEAVELLRRAVTIEAEIAAGFGPPVPAKPAHELLAETLLELGRGAEARAAFEAALARTPGRAQTLAGLARAAEKLGDDEDARSLRAELAEIRRHADEPKLQSSK